MGAWGWLTQVRKMTSDAIDGNSGNVITVGS